MQKGKTLLFSLMLAGAALAWSAAAEACTSFLVGRGASADGSTMITYAADSHVLYGDIEHTPARDWPEGSMRTIIDWDTQRPLGEIPQVGHTYAVTGNMNEHGVAIGESTWGGHEELWGSEGIDYGSLITIALERSATAREALEVMTTLPQIYGYASEGESFSIADGNEAWILEMIGKGKEEKGTVWVARRVPDDCISGHANNPRIHTFPLNNPETLYSADVIDFARRKGYYTGSDADFSFSKAYADYDMSATRGCDGRVWSFFRHHVPAEQMDAYLPWIMLGEGDPFPLWVKPQAKLTVDDLKADMRDHFEGTPMDMTNDLGAGPYKAPYRWRPMTFEVDGVKYYNERATATQQTGFSFVAQLDASAPEGMKGILWWGPDDTNTTVYVPLYSGSARVPRQFAKGNGDLLTLSWDAAFWVANYVANQAYHRYSQMIPDIRREQQGQETALGAEVAALRAEVAGLEAAEAAERLAAHSDMAAERFVKGYKELGDYLLVKYLDGNVKKEKDGRFETTEYGVPASPLQPGYSPEFYRAVAKDAGDRLKVTY